jgi:hypothetical protein
MSRQATATGKKPTRQLPAVKTFTESGRHPAISFHDSTHKLLSD